MKKGAKKTHINKITKDRIILCIIIGITSIVLLTDKSNVLELNANI